MRKKLDKPVLAEGEVTGHAHVLQGNVDVFETDAGEREFALTEYIPLVHEEHGPVLLPPGEYSSDKVVEEDHFEKRARKVAD